MYMGRNINIYFLLQTLSRAHFTNMLFDIFTIFAAYLKDNNIKNHCRVRELSSSSIYTTDPD